MPDTAKRLGLPALVVSSGIMLSRVVGVARDITFAYVWGTGIAFAAFRIAFAVPNLLRALFGEGAFSAAFVPVFSQRLETAGKASAWGVAQRVVTVLGGVLAGVVALAAAASLLLRPFLDDELARLTLRLIPWVMPYSLLICLVAAFAGVLNSLQRFALPALAPVLLNLVFILATLFVCPYWHERPEAQIFGLAAAVLLAGTLQLALMLLACRREGLVFRLAPDWRAPEVRRVAWLMAPALLGSGVAQVNVLIDNVLAGVLGSQAVGALYYSQRLVYLPVGVFGVAMAVVCLPAMSKAAAHGGEDELREHLLYGLRHVLFLALPATAMLGLLGIPIVRLLFQRGAFTELSAAETRWALNFYLAGIPAFTCAKIAVTPYYARQDTKTPVKVGAVCLALNIVLNLTLMWVLRQGGLALATTLCSYLNVGLLLALLRRQIGALRLRSLLPALLRTGAATVAALAAAALVRYRLEPVLWSAVLLGRVAAVFVPLGAGATVYLATSLMLHSPELAELTEPLRRGGRRHSGTGPHPGDTDRAS